jgi:hypothetical protein
MINETNTYKRLKGLPKNNFPKWLFVHHSGGADAQPMLDTSNHTAQDMEAWHLAKGWDGLGYQYVIHKNGDLWAGRPEHRNGAHAVGYNEQSLGICLAGNFDATMPTEAQKLTLATLLKEKMTQYSIPPENIVPHRKFANKTCYGKLLADDWARKLVATPTPETPKSIIIKRLSELTKLVEQLKD